MTQNHIVFFDTTLRDGEQSPGCSMTTQEKLTMAHALEDLGVDVLEAGFAVASEGDFAAISTIAQAIRKPKIASLARAKQEDIELAGRSVEHADRPRIHVFLASSDLHLEYKLKISRQEALDRTAESIRLARSFVEDVEFSPEDATRSDRNFLVEMVRVAIEAGATTINMPDTVGYTTPDEYARMFREVRERIPAVDAENIILSAHCHDDLGLAVANSLAAIQAGARQVECAINGIGERAGNAALEELAAALYVRKDYYGVDTSIKLEKLYPTSEVLGQIITFKPSPNKAIVGTNAFAHESGIHQHGMLANPLCYEIMTPASVGVAKTNLVLGKHSGRAALRDRLEKLGFTLDRDELQQTYYRFVALADRKKNIYDQDLIKILPDAIRERRGEPVV
ncbi:2-isopropylmalate synthase [Terracidiphilus gabretensis]|uniref:2-isopropylmalate synthase n=1 Tax=Terracidiphilus gabretensis TaxID=1577687 RepID=UPI00071B3CBC|nr:2-isopropylmalate synthase [Terracidiphilus gabretensis]